MIKVKGRNYYINEKLVLGVFKDNGKYFAKLGYDEIVEIGENDYLNMGGE